MKRSAREFQLEALAETLWGERRLVEYLLFKLVTAKLLLAADERRFVALAMDEVETVLSRLREHELHRAMALEPLARDWGIAGEDLTLTELTRRAPAAYQAVFRDHQDAFRRMAAEIDVTTATNRQLAANGLGQQELRQADDALLTARADLSHVQELDIAEVVMELQIEQVAHEAALQALAPPLPPTLANFLR